MTNPSRVKSPAVRRIYYDQLLAYYSILGVPVEGHVVALRISDLSLVYELKDYTVDEHREEKSQYRIRASEWCFIQ